MSTSVRRAECGHTFKFVGLHLDLRVQIMPFPALCKVAREAAELGFNTLVVEWEASFPFRQHGIISNEFAYTEDEVAEFIRLCGDLGLTVIPVQQCFGHVEYILRHERYAELRESNKDFCQLCPEKADRALEIFGEIFEEIAAAHPAPYLHIGGDETYLLGHCESCRAKAAEVGRSKLYVDYFQRVASHVLKMNRQPLLWADMLLRHPESAHEMPRDAIFVDWNYGWPVDRFGDPSLLRRTDFRFWGAAAMRSAPDNHWLTCWNRHFQNLTDYIPYTKSMGFEGILLTSWSTSGVYGYHWDSETTAMDILPVRRVYPLAGFRILLAAFAEAVRRDTPLDSEAFVADYAVERFGLTKAEGKRLWKALIAGETEARSTANPAARKLAGQARKTLLALKPRRHVREFQHLRLMADLRDHHLRFLEIERQCQLGRFSAAKAGVFENLLAPLVLESRELQRRFAKLNAGELYETEMKSEEAYRFGRLRQLHARLRKSGRRTSDAEEKLRAAQ